MDCIAATESGELRGVRVDEVIAFKGVPFAAPPVGELRFRQAIPPEPWDGIREATTFGATPPQLPGPLTGDLPDQDEDCLYLNVWTPGLDGAQRPVMVWLHGGGFMSHAAAEPAWHGKRLAAFGDVVVVSIEYRTGALGFLHLAEGFGADFASSGVNGLLDQIAGLEWVRDNIAAFGGNANYVTIFGESAGGMSVGCLLTMPPARGLFKKAILQSGAASSVMSTDLAAATAAHFLEIVGVGKGDLGALEALTVDAVLDGQAKVIAEFPTLAESVSAGLGALGLPFRPVVDGHAMPVPPMEAIAEGAASDVPVLVGTCRDEWRLFSELLRVPTPKTEDRLAHLFGRIFSDKEAAESAARTYVENRRDEHPRLAGAAALGDFLFRIPAIRLAEARDGQTADTFMFRFDWPTPVFEGRLGACHGVELTFIFDPDERSLTTSLSGAHRPVELTRAVQEAWTAFARSGDPNCEALPEWPRYDTTRRATMILDDAPKVVDDPDAGERAIWADVL